MLLNSHVKPPLSLLQYFLQFQQRRETGIDLVPLAAALPLVQVPPATRTHPPAVRAAARHHRKPQQQVLAPALGHVKHQAGTHQDAEVLRAPPSPPAASGPPN